MRNINVFYACMICFFVLNCCTTWKETLKSTVNTDNAIDNAITDFVYTSKLSKKDSIFSVAITHTNEEKIIIAIVVADDEIYPNSQNNIGTYDNIFPTRYIVKKGKLFYWNDSTQVITQDIISVLEKYNHIDYRWSELPVIVGGVHNDGLEGVIYYFCKNDLKNYKKKKADNIQRHYRTPKLNCK